MAGSAPEYKKRNIAAWNEVAPRYHRRWASSGIGPFQSTDRLVELLDVGEGSRVLDVACGTGVVTRKLAQKVGRTGIVVGADMSAVALKVAKRWNRGEPNVHFVNFDAERMGFAEKFDAVSCQYALFFFPDASRALRNMKYNLKESGSVGIAVHGHNVPFYVNILDAVKEFIPDYIPPGTPQLDRYGSEDALREVVEGAGLTSVSVRRFVFRYSPGTFEEYWGDYRRYVAKPLKEKLRSLGRKRGRQLKEQIAEATVPYTDGNGIIEFPWEVLILTAKR